MTQIRYNLTFTVSNLQYRVRKKIWRKIVLGVSVSFEGLL